MIPSISLFGFLSFVAMLMLAKFTLLAVSTSLTKRNEDSPMAQAIGALF